MNVIYLLVYELRVPWRLSLMTQYPQMLDFVCDISERCAETDVTRQLSLVTYMRKLQSYFS